MNTKLHLLLSIFILFLPWNLYAFEINDETCSNLDSIEDLFTYSQCVGFLKKQYETDMKEEMLSISKYSNIQQDSLDSLQKAWETYAVGQCAIENRAYDGSKAQAWGILTCEIHRYKLRAEELKKLRKEILENDLNTINSMP